MTVAKSLEHRENGQRLYDWLLAAIEDIAYQMSSFRVTEFWVHSPALHSLRKLFTSIKLHFHHFYGC